MSENEKAGPTEAEQIAAMLSSGRRAVMSSFGAEYGPRVAPFLGVVRDLKRRLSCTALGVFGFLNETHLAGMFDRSATAMLLAALHDEVVHEERSQRRIVTP